MKTYQLTTLYTYLTHYRLTNGRQVQVEFKGVQNMGIHGSYSTADTELQQAMEDSVAYRNGVFRIVAENTDEEANESRTEAPENKGTQSTPDLFNQEQADKPLSVSLTAFKRNNNKQSDR